MLYRIYSHSTSLTHLLILSFCSTPKECDVRFILKEEFRLLKHVIVSPLPHICRAQSILMLETATAFFVQIKVEYTQSKRVEGHEMEVAVRLLRVKAM